MTIELIYDRECPNVEAARDRLRDALRAVGRSGTWQEWDRADPASPTYAQSYGSPTILINGQDVAAQDPTGDANCCRVYTDDSGAFAGVPPMETIVAALQTSIDPSQGAGVSQQEIDTPRRSASLGGLAIIGSAFLASLCCIGPLVIAGLGLGGAAFFTSFEAYRPWFMGLTVAALGTAFYFSYRKKDQECAPGTACAAPASQKWSRAGLWGITLITAGLLAFPYLPGMYRGVSSVVIPAAASQVTLDVEGMTCSSCDVAVETRLTAVDGVYDATADFETSTAAVYYNPAHVTPHELADAVNRLGYTARVRENL